MPFRGSTSGAGYTVAGASSILDRQYTVGPGTSKDTPLLRALGFGRFVVQVNQTTGGNPGFFEIFTVQGNSPNVLRLFRTVVIGAILTPEIFESALAARSILVRVHGPGIASNWDVNIHLTGTS